MSKLNDVGLPIVVRSKSGAEALAFEYELQDLGFKHWGQKGHCYGMALTWVNIHTRIFAPGLPGIQICAHICGKIIPLADFREIMRIFDLGELKGTTLAERGIPYPTEAQLEERRRIKRLKIEFTNEQRQPGVKNPLTPDQVLYFQIGWGGLGYPSDEVVQNVAEELLPKGAGVNEIRSRLVDFI